MKKVFLFVLLVAFAATAAFAAPFGPTPLKLTAPAQVKYNFDGTKLSIPLTVSGKSANSIFMVYTKDKAASIGKIKNGFLGWHTVNKIDTCLYWAVAGQYNIGSQTISWEGKDTYGTKIPAGSYTYYVWAYDSQAPKELALKGLNPYGFRYVMSKDEKGLPVANPVFYVGLTKWPVGIDPLTDAATLEKTAIRTGVSFWGYSIALDPADHTKFWAAEFANMTLYYSKYKWVPNGTSTLEAGWASKGTFTWSTQPGGSGTFGPGIVGDDKEMLYSSFVNQYDKNPVSQVLYLSMSDGTQERIVDLSDWYCSKQDLDGGGQMNGGPSQINFMNGRLFTQGQQACMALAIDPARDSGDEILWVNDNGDLVHDYHYEKNDAHPWMCNDFMVGPYMYTYSTDPNEFCTFPSFDLGAVTFGLIGPAGTGIGYFADSGETANQKNTSWMLNVGSAYDGMYHDNQSNPDKNNQAGIWYVGYDSIKGVISNQVGVSDAPSSFSVAQNTPNPFNPATTISFTLAKAGTVTVEVYNVSGQKVDTIANAAMSAGSHSVVWNASKFSAGVYFCTVKAGNFSKTLKMTYLK